MIRKSGIKHQSHLTLDNGEGVTVAVAAATATATATATWSCGKSNVACLEWNQVDLARRTAWVFSDQAKGNEDIHVSLNDIAMEVLQRQIGKHPERVFTYLGNPIKWLNTQAWRNALKRSGISNFRWHDLRHTWASWWVQNGTPLYDLQEMGAWKSGVMVKRYAHLANRAAIITGLLNDTNLTHSRNEKGLTSL